MALKLPIVPPGTNKVVANALKRLHSTKRFSSMATTGAGPVVTPAAPHQVFTIAIDQLLAGHGLKAAKPAGWRTLILQGDSPIAAVEYRGQSEDPSDFKSMNQGRFVNATVAAMTAAEATTQIKQQDYEPRLLQIAAIYLVSLWLHGKTDNLFIPLEPAPSSLKPNQLYTEPQFFKLVMALAAQQKQREGQLELLGEAEPTA